MKKINDKLSYQKAASYSSDFENDLTDIFIVWQDMLLAALSMPDSLEKLFNDSMAIDDLIGFDESFNIDKVAKSILAGPGSVFNIQTFSHYEIDIDFDTAIKSWIPSGVVGPKPFQKARIRDIAKKYVWKIGEGISGLVGKVFSSFSKKTQEKEISFTTKNFSIISGKNVVIPDAEQFAKMTPAIKVSRVNGYDLTNEMKDGLREDLRNVIRDKGLIYQQGFGRGQQRVDLVNEFKKKIKTRFHDYTVTDPKYGTPRNINAIALTEVRMAVANGQTVFYKEAQKQGHETMVDWIHNPHLSKTIRIPHAAMNKVRIKFGDKFTLKSDSGVFMVDGPYDPILPASETVNCKCEKIHYLL